MRPVLYLHWFQGFTCLWKWLWGLSTDTLHYSNMITDDDVLGWSLLFFSASGCFTSPFVYQLTKKICFMYLECLQLLDELVNNLSKVEKLLVLYPSFFVHVRPLDRNKVTADPTACSYFCLNCKINEWLEALGTELLRRISPLLLSVRQLFVCSQWANFMVLVASEYGPPSVHYAFQQ